jgi:hypothetical protein
MIMPSDTSSMQQITVPGPVITHKVIVPASPHVTTATTHVAATDAAVTSWWQQAWVALYKLLQ